MLNGNFNITSKSRSFRPVMNSSYFKFVVTSYKREFTTDTLYQITMGFLGALTVLKQTVAHNNMKKHIYFYRAMVDMSIMHAEIVVVFL